MSRKLIRELAKLKHQHPDYKEEINLLMYRIEPKKSQEYLSNSVLSYMEILCNNLDISKKDFLEKRSRDVLYYRYSLIAYLKHNTDMTLRQIGKLFGNKDHSTIINALNAVKDALHPYSYNQELSDTYYKVKDALEK